jgi:hypothetical protein
VRAPGIAGAFPGLGARSLEADRARLGRDAGRDEAGFHALRPVDDDGIGAQLARLFFQRLDGAAQGEDLKLAGIGPSTWNGRLISRSEVNTLTSLPGGRAGSEGAEPIRVTELLAQAPNNNAAAASPTKLRIVLSPFSRAG